MKSEEILRDREARRQIEEEIRENFFVEAGAGSGKTTELVKRMVNMVKTGLPVEKICAITFTKAAANEFYARFKTEVEKAAGEGNGNCRDALRNIDLCFMGTIDSFCQMILSEHPAEAGIPSDAGVVDDAELDIYFRRAYSDIQNGKYGKEMADLCRRFRDLNGRAEEIFLGLTRTLMNRRNSEFQYVRPMGRSYGEYFAEEKQVLCALYKGLTEHPELLVLTKKNGEELKKCVNAWDAFSHSRAALFGDWDDEVPQLMRALPGFAALRVAGDADLSLLGMGAQALIPHDDKGNYYDLSTEYCGEITEKLKEEAYGTAMELAERAVKLFVEELRKKGLLTFFDYQYYLKEMLKKDAAGEGKLIRHIYDRHSYFLLDEFQDTDPMQAEIFFYLAAEKTDPDWKKCIPHKGALFIVGDPKQSIYRFRNADIEAFNRVKALFTGDAGKQVMLTQNFRSTGKLCGWFDEVFTELFPKEDQGEQSRFEKIPLDEKTDIEGTFSGIYRYEVGSVPEDPESVVRIIQKLVGNEEFLIQEKEDKEKRKVRYKDIMVITSSKGKLADYVREFARNRIPYRVEGKAEFSACPALKTAADLYAAAAFPESMNAVYRGLTSGIFGIGNADLLEERYQGRLFDVFGKLDQYGNESIREALKKLRGLYEKSVSLSPAGLFSTILEECEVLRRCGCKNAEYVFYALELLRTREAAGEISTAGEGSTFLDSLLAGDSGLERVLSLTMDQDRVHLANLHKVKGLEAPIVILATARSFSRVTERTDLSDLPARSWIFSVPGENGSLLSAPGFDMEKDLEKESQAMEKIRLLYVAATRARRALIMGYFTDKNGEIAESNYWYELLNTAEREFELPTETVGKEIREVSAAEVLAEAGKTVFDGSASGERSFSVHTPSSEKLMSVMATEDALEDKTDEEVREERAKRKENAALIGTMVHRLMEVLVTSRNSVDLNAAVEDILSEYDAEPDKYEAMLLKVGTTIRNGGFAQKTDVPQDILAELLSAEEVCCELPFCYKEGTEIWNGVMDVVYKKCGNWHIVDYKTNAEDTGLDQEYENQLEAYKKAFRLITGNEADAKIYHMDVQG